MPATVCEEPYQPTSCVVREEAQHGHVQPLPQHVCHAGGVETQTRGDGHPSGGGVDLDLESEPAPGRQLEQRGLERLGGHEHEREGQQREAGQDGREHADAPATFAPTFARASSSTVAFACSKAARLLLTAETR